MAFHRMPAAIAAGLVLALLAGCTEAPAPAAEPAPAAPPEARPSVVIAVIDTGMNLYHGEYLRPAGAVEPAGIPARAPVQLTLGAESFDDAREADEAALMAMERETLYTFPGTKVLAGISFQDRADDWPLILDRPGVYTHGTMTTSRAVGNTVAIGGAEADIWLVIVQGFSADSVRWAAQQPWIDLISISAGISPYSIVPGAPNALDSEGIPAYNAASHAKPFFASTGNGLGNAGVAGFPAATRGSSGVPDAVSVGANDNDRMSQWHNQGPYISADGCANPAAQPDSLDAIDNTGGGTSSATPFSAGGGALLLLQARQLLRDTAVGPRAGPAGSAAGADAWSSGRVEDATVVLAQGAAGLVAKGPLADGVFTLLEFKDVLYHTALVTATEDPSDGDACEQVGTSPTPADAVPEDQRFAVQGYGEVNHASIAAAVAVLLGQADLPERPADDESYAQQRGIKMQVVGDSEG
jgi:hypothetical protein